MRHGTPYLIEGTGWDKWKDKEYLFALIIAILQAFWMYISFYLAVFTYYDALMEFIQEVQTGVFMSFSF